MSSPSLPEYEIHSVDFKSHNSVLKERKNERNGGLNFRQVSWRGGNDMEKYAWRRRLTNDCHLP